MNKTDTTRILGIETSCDETAASVVENGRKILSNVVASQVDLHAQYGGVFPEMASRQHVVTIYSVVEKALKDAHLSISDIDAIAVTQGPGLAGSLVVGINMAKGLSQSTGIPLINLNHLEGHIYASWLYEEEEKKVPEFPIMALIVSGGHTELNLVKEHLDYTRLGATLDDAAGEAFDKVARLLGLGYPGGPAIQKAAQSGNPQAVNFPRALMDQSWDFSFSGLKTAVLRLVKEYELQNSEHITRPLPVNDIAASFEAAVVDVLVVKTIRAAEATGAKSILIAGGVSANARLRREIVERSPVDVFIPPLKYCTDNAAMIAAAGYYRLLKGLEPSTELDVRPSWRLAAKGD
jgi:N6-L-threonylcarbamoyladenine synthase